MIRSIVRASIQFRYLVAVLAGVLMLYGVTQLRQMPVDALPEFSPPFVEIQTEALGLSAEEVEQMITVPMEQDLLAGVAWLDVIRSESVPGLSSVVIYFEPGTDLYRARQMVAERLAQAAVGIPNVSKPPMMIQPTSSASRFMIVGMSSEKLSLIEMSVLARWTIGPRLLSVPGVANVAIWGNRDQQLQVLVDPNRLRDAGITLDQIVATTGNALWVSPLSYLEASTPGTGGFIDTPTQRLGVWHVLPVSTPEDLAKVPIERTLLRLGDVTEIVEDHQPLIGDALVNDSSNLMLVIEKLPGTNALEVTEGVESAIDALRPGFTEITFDSSIFRPAAFIEAAISNLTRTLIMSALIAVLLLGFLFYGWRTALLSLVTIPLSLLAALVVLHLRGMALNAMVLAGLVLALGIVVDESIVGFDLIAKRLRRARAAGNPGVAVEIISDSTAETRGALMFATLAILLTTVPFLFLPAATGALTRPLVTSYALAVLAAMVVALVVGPALSMLVYGGGRSGTRETSLLQSLQRGYEGLLTKVLQRSAPIWILAAVLVIAGAAALAYVWRTPLLPAFREPYLMVRFDGAAGTSLPEMDRIALRASGEIRGIPGVRNVAVHVGRAVLGDQVVGINSAEMWVSLDSKADYDVTLAQIQDTVAGYPGLHHEVRTYLQDRLEQPSQTAVDSPFTVRLFGEDQEVLLAEVDKLRQVVAGIRGVSDARYAPPVREPNIQIEANLDSAQQYGVKPGDVRRAAATLLSGIHVGSLFEQQKVFDVVVWGTPEVRQDLSDIRDLLLDTPGGGHVTLGEVATVQIASTPLNIRRVGLSPYIDIGFDVRGRGSAAVLADIKHAMRSYAFPSDYHAEVFDNYAVQRTARTDILIATVLAAVGAFLLLQAAVRNWRMALATYISLGLALAGGALAALLTGSVLSLTALSGLLAVFGIAMRQSILLIDQYLSLGRQGETSGFGLITRGSIERLAPELIAVLTAGLILLPFVLFGNAAGYEILRPMAVVILGGLITTTLVQLFVLPILYLRYGSAQESDLGFGATSAD